MASKELIETDASEEAVLVEQAVAGSNDAFARIVRLHQADVRWCLFQYVRNRSTVDDLAQEVFLRAYRGLSDFRGLGSLRSWLLGTARNVAKQHIRADARRRTRETGPLATELARQRLERLEQHKGDDENVEERLRLLRDCIQSLAPESRRVVEDHYFEKRTLESIAERQGRNGGALRVMLFRARKALAACIRNKLQEEA